MKFSVKNAFVLATLGAVYILLFLACMPYTLPVESPSWWYSVLGKSVFTVLLWAHLAHGIGVFLGAIPVALVITIKYPTSKYKVAILTSLVFVAFMGLDQAKSDYFEVAESSSILISGIVDLIKPIPVLLLAVFMMSRFLCVKIFKS